MIEKWKFPAGEVGVRVVPDYPIAKGVVWPIDFYFTGSDSIMQLLFIVDAFRRLEPSVKLRLNMPYVPYARQDRVMTEGESHSLKVFCKLINDCRFEEVHIADPHSSVTEALLDNVFVTEQHECLWPIVSDIDSYDYLIAPDAGALKKIYKLAKLIQKPVVCANKTRNVKTGEIIGTQVSASDYAALKGKKALVVDDICDGGATFIELAKALPTCTEKHLYVTHGIFSKGKDVLSKKYSKIMCYNDMSKNK